MIFINGNKVSQVVCLNCHMRWIAARPIETKLAALECPECGYLGDAIETGETSIAEDLIRKAAGETDGIPDVCNHNGDGSNGSWNDDMLDVGDFHNLQRKEHRVIISGINKLPEFCYDCPCSNEESGYCQADQQRRRPDSFDFAKPEWCPLILERDG